MEHATTGMDDTQVPPRGPWRGVRVEVDVVGVAVGVVVGPNSFQSISIHPKTIQNLQKTQKFTNNKKR